MKHVKRLLTLLAVAILLAGCSKTEPAVVDTEEMQATTEVTVSTESGGETTVSIPDIDIAPLSNVWSIVDSEGVEEIELLRGLEKDEIDKWSKNTEFTEIKLYQRTYWDSVRLGVYGDMAVAQMAMAGANDWECEDVVWNVRMEKTDGLENRTGIVVPEDAIITENSYTLNTKSGEVPVCTYFWVTSGDLDDKSKPVTTTEMHLIYFEDTRNLYTIYSNELVYKWGGDRWVANWDRMPTVVFNYIKADGEGRYGINANEISRAKYKTEKDIRYFRIKMTGQGKATYQYEFGMTLAQWVQSEYNTDGWKFDSKDPYIVISADGRYKLNKDDYCWREMTAQLHGPAK